MVTGNVAGNEVQVPNNQIDLSTSPFPYGIGWDYASNVYTILNGADVVVTGTSFSSMRLEVAENGAAKVTFDGVTMICPVTPFTLNNNAEVTLTIVGANTLATDLYSTNAGIQVAASAALIINGTGSLFVAGGLQGAGISGGAITINGGTVIAKDSEGGGEGISVGTLAMHGNALIFASSVGDTDPDGERRTSGILVIDNATHWYGADTLTIDYDALIPLGQTLTVALGKTLVVEATLTVYGTLIIEGEIIKAGEIITEDDGEIEGEDKIVTQVGVEAIAGVTSPEGNATPSNNITDGTNFTAQISWNGNPAIFNYNTAYTATITLTAEEGYTFFGYDNTAAIAGFTVNDIAPVFVNNDGTTLVFTITFPATQAAPTYTVSPELSPANPLRAWVRGGMLHITGLTAGETLSIYTSTGVLVHQSKPNGKEIDINLNVQGVYIVQSGGNTVRVVSSYL